MKKMNFHFYQQEYSMNEGFNKNTKEKYIDTGNGKRKK